MKIKKFCLVLQPVLGILYREIKNRARNEKIYKTNSRLQFNSDSLNNIWEFLQKGAKNWVQHFFSKKMFLHASYMTFVTLSLSRVS